MNMIQFQTGAGRHYSGSVNYLATVDCSIYAECRVPDGVSDDYGYLTMKKVLLAALGVRSADYVFFYDGQEDALAADAAADCEVIFEID